MVPTGFLRQQKHYAMICNIKVLTDVVTQQWWTEVFISGQMRAPTPEHKDATRFGEWRDVIAVGK